MIADRIKPKTDTQQKRKKMLKHNTARKKNKRTLFFLNDIDECKNNISERNKVLFSKAEKKKKSLGKWETKEKKTTRLCWSGITRC